MMCEITKAICDDNFQFLETLFEKGDVEGIRRSLYELRIRRVLISSKMDAYLCENLVDYSYKYERNYVKPDQTKINNDIEGRVKLVIKYCRVLKEKYSTDDLNDMDMEFYTILKILFEQFYFIKSRSEYRHLKVAEITYCIAIFLKFVHLSQAEYYSPFRMIINKNMLLQFLSIFETELSKPLPKYKWDELMFLNLVKVVSVYKNESNLLITAIWMSLYPNFKLKSKEISFVKLKLKRNCLKDLIDENVSLTDFLKVDVLNSYTASQKKVFKDLLKEYRKFDRLIARKNVILQTKLNKTFQNLKQLFAMKRLLKCVSLLKKYTDFFDKALNKRKPFFVSKHCTVKDLFAVKRIFQIFGECLKSTKSTPNITKKLNQMIEKFTSAHLFETTNTMRQDFSHGFSLRNIFFDIENEMLSFLGQYQFYWNEISNIIYRFYEECLENTIQIYCANLMALNNMKQVQTYVVFAKVCTFQDDCNTFLIDDNKIAIKELEDFNEHFRHSDKTERLRSELIEILDEEIQTLDSKWSRKVTKQFIDLVEKQNEIKKVRIMLKYYVEKLQYKCTPDFFEEKKNKFMELSSLLLPLRKDHRNEYMGLLLNKFNFPASTATNTLTMLNDLYFIDIIKYNEYSKEIANKLDLRLSNTQFDDFHVVLKKKYYHNIFDLPVKEATVKEFCKKEGIRLDLNLVEKMQSENMQTLQKIFDSHIETLKDLLKEDKSDLCNYALEYILLTLSEMMTSVGYFQDNYHFLKQNCPVIAGRNFRNFLAHDYVLYETLTNFDPLFICKSNGKAFVTLNLNIFSNPKENTKKLKLPSLDEKIDSSAKLELQQRELLNAILTWSFDSFMLAISRGAIIDFQTICNETFVEHCIESNLRKFYNFFILKDKDDIFEYLYKNTFIKKIPSDAMCDYIREKALQYDRKVYVDINLHFHKKLNFSDLNTAESIDFQFLSDLKKNFPSLIWNNPLVVYKIVLSCDLEAIKTFLGWNIHVESSNFVTSFACYSNQTEVIKLLLNANIKFDTESIVPLIAFKNNDLVPVVLEKIGANQFNSRSIALKEILITSDNLECLKYFLEVRKMKLGDMTKNAVRYGRLRILKYLLKNLGHVETENIIGLISISIICKSFDIAKFLTKLLAKRPPESSESLFFVLAWKGHLKLMKLVKNYLPCASDKELLKIAIESKNMQIVNFLYKNGVEIRKEHIIHAINIHANNIFHRFLTIDKTLEDLILNTQTGIECLYTSLESKNYEMMAYFVNKGINVNIISSKRPYCLLCRTLTFDDLQALNIILEAQNVNVNNPCKMALRPLGQSLSFRMFHRMIEAGATLEPKSELQRDHFGPFPFTFFINPMCLEYIYEHYHFDPNELDKNGATILHFIVKFHNNTSVLRIVLSLSQLDINIADRYGYTALHQAVISLNSEAVKMLLDKSCNIDDYDKNGLTPFMLSFMVNNYEIGKLLFDKGANVRKLILHLSFRCQIGLLYLKGRAPNKFT